MPIDRFADLFESDADMVAWLRSAKVKNIERGKSNLLAIKNSRMTFDLVSVVCSQLERELPLLSDPDMALNNLDRFVAASRSPLGLGGLFERDPESLSTLLQIFSNSQYLSDVLIRDHESFDLLRLTEGQPIARQMLIDDICADVAALSDERDIVLALRRHKERETLRIAYGDIVKHQSVDTVTKQISYLADAICEAAVRAARRKMEARHGVPRRFDRRPARFVVLALGKLGGCELNYSSDIDLIYLCDEKGKTDGPRSVDNLEFFIRMANTVSKMLTENTVLGTAYRVDLRLRPEGDQGQNVIGLYPALHYYDVSGRTWERQAFVKARAIAGDLDLGTSFLEQLEPWVYRRYLTGADITGIRALKRQIERRAIQEGDDERNVKTGRGGIRDIEFVIQFLQLLNGGDLQTIRTGNTLEAIACLEEARCLTLQERSILADNYEMLRKLEHRLQIMFDLQTHTIPEKEEELRKLAIRMDFDDGQHRSPLEAFRADYKEKRELNRAILNFLMLDAFGEGDQIDPAIDLLLDPTPSETAIADVLSPYGFRDTMDAYRNLVALSSEKIPFLSTRRCRYFLAVITPQLLDSIAGTPDPDSTLVNLSQVSDSLGGKGALWELFSFNSASLQLYVHLCAATPYLSGMLTSNPGMIDDLMDSLVLDKLPTVKGLENALNELSRGAEDIVPILHSFKNSMHLLVGVRDILGKEDIRNTHRVLSGIAEVCVNKIVAREYARMVERFGTPTVSIDTPCELIILAMGKLGGREPNYHSDLDVIFLFEADGITRHPIRSRSSNTTTNQHFFSQLAQRVIKEVNQLGPQGRLYELDPRLRPTGKSGSLAISLAEFERYFTSGQGQLWERQALCKARPIYGGPTAREAAKAAVQRAILDADWQPRHADDIREMRMRLQESASARNLKRGLGGTVDIEFAVQMLQLKHGRQTPQVLVPGTLDAIGQLQAAGYLSEDDGEYLQRSYRFLRSIEARLRLMNTTARHDFPSDALELKKLAFLLGYESPEKLADDCQNFTRENRERFGRLIEAAKMNAQ